jgi:hypothetical protein
MGRKESMPSGPPSRKAKTSMNHLKLSKKFEIEAKNTDRKILRSKLSTNARAPAMVQGNQSSGLSSSLLSSVYTL